MVLSDNIIIELEPKVRSIIKKQLGFSEPTLLAAAINSINAGASKEILSSNELKKNVFGIIFIKLNSLYRSSCWITGSQKSSQIS